MNMELKKFILYLLEWLTPSCTAVYIVLTDKISWGTYILWGYSVNIPSYIIASLTGAAIFYYLNKYIFKKKDESIEITINGMVYHAYPNDTFMVWETSIRQERK